MELITYIQDLPTIQIDRLGVHRIVSLKDDAPSNHSIEPVKPQYESPSTTKNKQPKATTVQKATPSKPAFDSPESVKARVKAIIDTLKKVNLKSPREKIEEGLASLVEYWDRLPSKTDDEAPTASVRKFIAWIDLEYTLIGNTAISEIEAALDGIWSDYTAERTT